MSKSDDARDLLLIELAHAVQQIAEPAGRDGVTRALQSFMAARGSPAILDQHSIDVARVAQAISGEAVALRGGDVVSWTNPPTRHDTIMVARSALRALREVTEDTKAAGVKALEEALAKPVQTGAGWWMRGLAGEVFRAMIEEMLR